MTGGLNMLPAINVAVGLARHRKAGQPLLGALQRTRKSLQDGLDARRNLAVHGHTTLVNDVWLAMLPRRGGTPEPHPASEVAHLAADIDEQLELLMVALKEWRAIGKWKLPKVSCSSALSLMPPLGPPPSPSRCARPPLRGRFFSRVIVTKRVRPRLDHGGGERRPVARLG